MTGFVDSDIEVSLFGPGIGESVCVKVNDKWLIIDSCINPETKNPIALDYLAQQNVDLKSDIACIIISHWHDDHSKGIAKICEACPNSPVVFSSVFTTLQFNLLSELTFEEDTSSSFPSGMDEMSKVVKMVKEKIKKQPSMQPVILASGDTRLYKSETMEVWALSPSPSAVFSSMEWFSRELEVQKFKRRLVPQSENLNAVAVMVITKETSILLGADLETHESNNNIGWEAVVNSQNKPSNRSSIFKVPHHGSSNGHHDQVWTHMLENNPTCILTPYTRSKLPLDTDIDRLKSYSNKIYQTNPSKKKSRPTKRDNVVDKLIKGIVTSRAILAEDNIGFIRVFIDKNGQQSFSMSEGAISH